MSATVGADAASSDKEKLESVDRAVDSALGSYGQGIDIERLVESLESAGWRWSS